MPKRWTSVSALRNDKRKRPWTRRHQAHPRDMCRQSTQVTSPRAKSRRIRSTRTTFLLCAASHWPQSPALLCRSSSSAKGIRRKNLTQRPRPVAESSHELHGRSQGVYNTAGYAFPTEIALTAVGRSDYMRQARNHSEKAPVLAMTISRCLICSEPLRTAACRSGIVARSNGMKLSNAYANESCTVLACARCDENEESYLDVLLRPR